MRFYEYERGGIYIDGVSLKEYPKEELRKKDRTCLARPVSILRGHRKQFVCTIRK